MAVDSKPRSRMLAFNLIPQTVKEKLNKQWLQAKKVKQVTSIGNYLNQEKVL